MLNSLTAKELEVMKFLWENEDGVTFGEIHDYVNHLGKELKRQTVNTYIQHLIEKGFVKVEGEERRKIYYPQIAKKEYDSMIAKSIVNQLFDGSLKKFVSALTGDQSLSDQEVKELKAILKKRR